MIRVVIDASAAVEYLLRTPLGQKLDDLLEEASLLAPALAIRQPCEGWTKVSFSTAISSNRTSLRRCRSTAMRAAERAR